MFTMDRAWVALFCTCAWLTAALGGCARSVIPNTHVEDTAENREVLEFVDSYRRAVESRDMGRLLSLASEAYFDDMGTPQGDDDIDYDGLRLGLVGLRKELLAARYQISYRNMTFVQDRVLVDMLYVGWFQIQTEEGPKWRRRLQPHRLVLVRRDGEYRILSGM